MKILVTGATGLIGGALLRQYAGIHTFTAITRNTSKPFKSDVTWIVSDYSETSLNHILHGKNFDAVVHLAGVRFLPTQDHFSHYLDNIVISENLFSACQKNDITNIVCASSRSVYSEKNVLPWRENQIPVPLNFYGISKLIMENISNIFNEKFDMKIKSLRIAQILSADERKGFLLRTLFDNAKKKQEQVIYGSGAAKREYLYIKDAVDAIIKACHKSDIIGAFNIGSGATISIKKLAELINHIFENSTSLRYVENKKEDLSVALMNCEKASAMLGFTAKFSVKDAIINIRQEGLKKEL